MFPKAPEARNWLEETRVLDRRGEQAAEVHEEYCALPDTTVDGWFEFWINNIVGDLAPNTRRNYRERYVHNVQPVIGKMLLRDVRPMHCKKILIEMDADYAGSTIRQTYIAMGTMFRSAILETGLRTGEMIGLTWDTIDWERRTLTVNKTLEFRHNQHYWRAGTPKTQTSYRTIPLTNRAYAIFRELYEKRDSRKMSEELAQVLTYTDRRTGQTASLKCKMA